MYHSAFWFGFGSESSFIILHVPEIGGVLEQAALLVVSAETFARFIGSRFEGGAQKTI